MHESVDNTACYGLSPMPLSSRQVQTQLTDIGIESTLQQVNEFCHNIVNRFTFPGQHQLFGPSRVQMWKIETVVIHRIIMDEVMRGHQQNTRYKENIA
ncbi:hypothetical protein K439DRAFT_403523 [Ramaria rubella]|nr:hypothetical protein K439DRAFT_403523 [Ramaria rubella]